jgi:hypothetical protein
MIFHFRKPTRRPVHRLRVTTKWAVLLAFALVAIPGHALHVLPGLDRFHGEAGSYDAKMGQAAHNRSTHNQPTDDDDCPICHFVAMGKTAGHSPICVSYGVTVVYLATAEGAVFSRHCEQPFLARGPPQV